MDLSLVATSNPSCKRSAFDSFTVLKGIPAFSKIFSKSSVWFMFVLSPEHVHGISQKMPRGNNTFMLPSILQYVRVEDHWKRPRYISLVL